MTAERLPMALWCVAASLLVVAYAAVVRPDEAAAAQAYATARILAARENALEQRLQRRRALRDAARRVERELAMTETVDGDEARLVRALANAASRTHLGIVSLSPADESGESGETGKRRLLSYRGVAIGVRGTFDDVLAFLPELCASDPLIEVRGVRIQARSHERRASPLLDVVVDARMYTVDNSALAEVR